MSSSAQAIHASIYPRLPTPLDPATIELLFSPRGPELEWVQSITHAGDTQVWLLTLLKGFEILGYFPATDDIPNSVLRHVAAHCGAKVPTTQAVERRTLYRHHQRIRLYLHVSPWRGQGRHLIETTMEKVARIRSNPADLINAAVECLVVARIELPALSTLRRVAGNVNARVQNEQIAEVHALLTSSQCEELDTLLVVKDTSLFDQLCQSTGSVSRKNVRHLIQRLGLLESPSNSAALLTSISTLKVGQWADEAQRMTVSELRAYRLERRRVLLLCLVHVKRSNALDDLATVFLKSVQTLKHRAKSSLQDWLSARHRTSEQMLTVFSDVLQQVHDVADPVDCHAKIQECLSRAGGTLALLTACEAQLEFRVDQWRDFLEVPYRSQRTTLLNILAALPLCAVNSPPSVLSAVPDVLARRSVRSLWVSLDIDDRFLERRWRSLVCHPDEQREYRHRALEMAVLLEVAEALRAGELYVKGSNKFGNYQATLFEGCCDLAATTAVLKECGLQDTSHGFVDELKSRLERASRGLEQAVNKYECIQLDKRGLPIVPRAVARTIPDSAEELAGDLSARMPNRAIVESLYNTDRWSAWTRHFGPPSRIDGQLDDPTKRYVLTAFAYGCGLGPAQAVRHFDTPTPEHLLRFVNRRHVSIDNLRAACTDMINLYAEFELPSCWGQGVSAGADGSLVETYTNNLLAAYHVRYQRTGSIAYRHIADNYVALFSQFVVCGVHEAVYILDGILANSSNMRPHRLHADSHGQSEAVFGLAYLLGIELMPRIRNWRTLRLYRAASDSGCVHTGNLYSGTIDWELIAANWDAYVRLILAIKSGRLTASAILSRLNSYSRRNTLYRALQELGRAVRTIYLLNWINDEETRALVTRSTNKVESFHAFAAHLNFGTAGISTTNKPEEQEKRMLYNQLVCNAVMLQNVADQTKALNELKRSGETYSRGDLAYLSPYGTSHLQRFGEYRTEFQADPYPDTVKLVVPEEPQ